MKIHIYIPIEHVIEGKLDPEHFTTYDPDNSHYVQVSITVDEFTRMWENQQETTSRPTGTQNYTYPEFKARYYGIDKIDDKDVN